MQVIQISASGSEEVTGRHPEEEEDLVVNISTLSEEDLACDCSPSRKSEKKYVVKKFNRLSNLSLNGSYL